MTTSKQMRNGFYRYSKIEKDFIKANYVTLSEKEIADKLYRTPAAIRNQLFVMKLSKRKARLKLKEQLPVGKLTKISRQNNGELIQAIQTLINNGAKISIAI